jgi:RNA polymerase sigma-70 factor, ECF subfamily
MDKSPLDAIEALYRTRYRDFLRVATAIVGNLETGRDVVHDAFVRAVRSIATYDASGGLDAWLFRIVVNSALTTHRHSRPTAVLELEPNTGTDRCNGGFDHDIRVAVAMLPERQRLIVFLRYYADLDYRAIANALDIEPGTVGAQLNAARHSLLAVIQEVPAHD